MDVETTLVMVCLCTLKLEPAILLAFIGRYDSSDGKVKSTTRGNGAGGVRAAAELGAMRYSSRYGRKEDVEPGRT